MLIEKMFKGLSFRPPGDDETYPVDCVIEHRHHDRSLVLLAGWWEGTGQPGDNILVVPSTVGKLPNGMPVFEQAPEYELTALADDDADYQYHQMRDRQDTARGTYMSKLVAYARKNPEYRFNPWIRAFMARPVIDTQSILKETTEGLREIGGITLEDQNNNVIDALVIDERGNAETLDPDGWLASFVNQWGDAQGRASIAEFIHWVSEQDVHGPYRFGQKYVGKREGTLEVVAETLARR